MGGWIRGYLAYTHSHNSCSGFPGRGITQLLSRSGVGEMEWWPWVYSKRWTDLSREWENTCTKGKEMSWDDSSEANCIGAGGQWRQNQLKKETRPLRIVAKHSFVIPVWPPKFSCGCFKLKTKGMCSAEARVRGGPTGLSAHWATASLLQSWLLSPQTPVTAS